MHQHMPPSKTGWPSLNVVIFPPVMRLILDNPKQRPPWRLLIKFTSYLGRLHPPIDCLPNGQTFNVQYYSSLLVQLKDILKEKCCRKFTKGSCSCMTVPWLTGHLQPGRNWLTWFSSVLITHHILRIWLHQTTTCSLSKKTIERSPFFIRLGGHCCCRDLVGWTTFRIFFMSGLQKLGQWAMKCIELRGK